MKYDKAYYAGKVRDLKLRIGAAERVRDAIRHEMFQFSDDQSPFWMELNEFFENAVGRLKTLKEQREVYEIQLNNFVIECSVCKQSVKEDDCYPESTICNSCYESGRP